VSLDRLFERLAFSDVLLQAEESAGLFAFDGE